MSKSLVILCLFLLSTQNAYAKKPNFIERLFGAKPDNENANDGEVVAAKEEIPASQDIRVVIDRNPKVQLMKIYLEGEELPWKTIKISTGRETFDIPTNYNRNPSCSVTDANEKGVPFHPQRLYENYQSETWLHKDESTGQFVGSSMPYSVFFNGGIAIHEATGDGIQYLGAKDGSGGQAQGGSGGCVRTDPNEVKSVFDLFAKKDADGKYSKIDMTLQSECRNSTTPRCTDPKFFPVKTNGRQGTIDIVDTRTPEEIKKVQEDCNLYASRFEARKKTCLATGKSNSECNREIHFEKITAKCHIREIERLPGHKRTIDPNQGMYVMSDVEALRGQQKPQEMAKIEQLCAQEVNSMMYVSPSDPAPRPTGIPKPKPRPTN